MRRFYIDWRKPHATYHKHRKRFLLTRARSCDGSSPGWHLWVYTYPNGVQHGRLIMFIGRWVSSPASGDSEHG